MEYIIVWAGSFLIGVFSFILFIGIVNVMMRSYKDRKLKKDIEKLNKKYLPNIVSCEICKCLMKEKDAYDVTYLSGFNKSHKFYCLKDAPSYIVIEDGKYFKVMEVDISGEPIGYKKK